MGVYEIWFRGELADVALQDLPSMRVRRTPRGTCLHGPLADQAALYGVLRMLQSFEADLLEVVQVPADEVDP